MVKKPVIDENGLKKGAWSPEEDNKLRSYIQRYGHWNWREIPKFAGLARCGKSCRLRWINYLRPNVKHGDFCKDEEDLIIKLHKQLGNRWSKIAASLPGRTDNEIKNYWHTQLKKRVCDQHIWTTDKKRKRNFTRKSLTQKLQIIHNNNQNNNYDSNLDLDFTQTNPQILESCPLSPQLSGNNSQNLSSNSETYVDTSCNTTTDHDCNDLASTAVKTLCLSSLDSMGSVLLDESFWTEPFALETSEQYYCNLDLSVLDEGMSFSPVTSYWENMDFLYSFSSDVDAIIQ
ncbi:transcription factor MYB13-like [Chenopodium quinoa]|uniref:Uncharacterized protein n=1 Tax=Chenopodium quinoa TaxID=63459 RepID=A0A803MR27_CHEQI|nr:transcription factor MYB13-like [Chenopodium quinoa]